MSTDAPRRDTSSTAARSAPLGTAVAVVATAAVCIGYAGWTLRPEPDDESQVVAGGTDLQMLTAQEPGRSLLSSEPVPEARLILEDGADLGVLPVINAHLEIPLDAESADAEPRAPTVRQLGFLPENDSPRPPEFVGAWLTGTIEPLPTAGPTSDLP